MIKNRCRWASYVEEFRRAGHQTVDWIAEFLLKARELRVLPDIKPGDLMDALPASAPEQGESFDVILRATSSSSFCPP